MRRIWWGAGECVKIVLFSGTLSRNQGYEHPQSDLVEALRLCKGAFISAAGFSFVINVLQLVPTIYMLQVYDRVVPTGNLTTLSLLTLILMVLFVTMGVLEWVRSQILVRVSTRIEVLLSERLLKVAYKMALYSNGQRASIQPLDDLTSLRQFMTGSGLFAFSMRPGCRSIWQ